MADPSAVKVIIDLCTGETDPDKPLQPSPADCCCCTSKYHDLKKATDEFISELNQRLNKLEESAEFKQYLEKDILSRHRKHITNTDLFSGIKKSLSMIMGKILACIEKGSELKTSNNKNQEDTNKALDNKESSKDEKGIKEHSEGIIEMKFIDNIFSNLKFTHTEDSSCWNKDCQSCSSNSCRTCCFSQDKYETRIIRTMRKLSNLDGLLRSKISNPIDIGAFIDKTRLGEIFKTSGSPSCNMTNDVFHNHINKLRELDGKGTDSKNGKIELDSSKCIIGKHSCSCTNGLNIAIGYTLQYFDFDNKEKSSDNTIRFWNAMGQKYASGTQFIEIYKNSDYQCFSQDDLILIINNMWAKSREVFVGGLETELNRFSREKMLRDRKVCCPVIVIIMILLIVGASVYAAVK